MPLHVDAICNAEFYVDMIEAFLQILVKRNVKDILAALLDCNQTS